MIPRWRKRLGDLAQLLKQAEQTYFQPELFRLNMNNAIQTARTVTFLIQKEKETIPEFNSWYQKNVLTPFANDKVMEWLKDARNVIEKEGDLVVHSSWRCRHIFSYTEEGHEFLSDSKKSLFVKLPALRALARRSLPSAIVDDSGLAIDRKWVANTLPEYELIDAIFYGYKRLAEVVHSLEAHLGLPPVRKEVTPLLSTSQMRRSFLKLSDGEFFRLESKILFDQPDERTREKFESISRQQGLAIFEKTDGFQIRVKRLAEFSAELFRRDGYHVPTCLLFGETPADFRLLTTNFSDHVDKLIFWHELAYTVRLFGLTAVMWISEAWVRDATKLAQKRIADLTVVGEGLHICGISKTEGAFGLSYGILRNGDSVQLSSSQNLDADALNFFAPIKKAWSSMN